MRTGHQFSQMTREIVLISPPVMPKEGLCRLSGQPVSPQHVLAGDEAIQRLARQPTKQPHPRAAVAAAHNVAVHSISASFDKPRRYWARVHDFNSLFTTLIAGNTLESPSLTPIIQLLALACRECYRPDRAFRPRARVYRQVHGLLRTLVFQAPRTL